MQWLMLQQKVAKEKGLLQACLDAGEAACNLASDKGLARRGLS
jgi:hypothetical protein